MRDFDEFDLILAMDRGHLRALQRMAPRRSIARKIRLFVRGRDVPDPYYRRRGRLRARARSRRGALPRAHRQNCASPDRAYFLVSTCSSVSSCGGGFGPLAARPAELLRLLGLRSAGAFARSVSIITRPALSSSSLESIFGLLRPAAVPPRAARFLDARRRFLDARRRRFHRRSRAWRRQASPRRAALLLARQRFAALVFAQLVLLHDEGGRRARARLPAPRARSRWRSRRLRRPPRRCSSPSRASRCWRWRAVAAALRLLSCGGCCWGG